MSRIGKNGRKYSWIPNLPDHRNHLFSVPPSVAIALPTSVDLRPQCPPVYDQLTLGSCTSNAIAGAIEFDRLKQGLPDFMPSRLFIYYCHDEKTEVLTDRGWQRWADYDGSLLGTVNPSTMLIDTNSQRG